MHEILRKDEWKLVRYTLTRRSLYKAWKKNWELISLINRGSNALEYSDRKRRGCTFDVEINSQKRKTTPYAKMAEIGLFYFECEEAYVSITLGIAHHVRLWKRLAPCVLQWKSTWAKKIPLKVGPKILENRYIKNLH